MKNLSKKGFKIIRQTGALKKAIQFKFFKDQYNCKTKQKENISCHFIKSILNLNRFNRQSI